MSTRLALYDLAQRHALAPAAVQALLRDAGLEDQPAGLRPHLWRGVAVLAASLVGLGVILWLAANWDTLGRTGRFAVLQGAVLVAGAAAALRPALRAPGGLAALLAVGGLFAYFGQTYQTGADAWQLFALWAVLTLPLALGARSDVLWAPWALVAMTAVALWTYSHTGHSWRVTPEDVGAYAVAWVASGLLVAALSAPLRHWTGAGPWSLRTAATLAIISLTLAGIGGLFHSTVAPHYVLATVLLAIAAFLLATRGAFDVFVLSAVALGLDTLLVGGLARWLFEGSRGDAFGSMLLLGLAAAGLVALSVSAVLRLARRHEEPDTLVEATP
jgi:uncharacterized membrane protein